MIRKNLKLAIAIFFVVIFVTACTVSPTGKVIGEKPIRIGYVGVLSGDFGWPGQEIQRGIELGVKEINQAGGINGRLLSVLYEDNQMSPQVSVTAFQKLITIDKASVIMVPDSPTVLPIAPLANNYKVPTIILLDASKEIDDAGDYVFSTGFSLEESGRLMARYAYYNLSKRRVAVLYDIDPWSSPQADAFEKEFTRLGGKITISLEHSADAKDYRSELLKIKNTNIDALYVVVIETSGLIIKQARELGMTEQILGSEIFGLSSVIEGIGNISEGVYFSYPVAFKESKEINDFKKEYRKEYGQEAGYLYYALMGYDGISLVAKVMQEKGTAPESIRNGIINARFQGLAGPIVFDNQGKIFTRTPHVNMIRNGEFISAE